MRKFSVPINLFLQEKIKIEITADSEEDAIEVIQNMSDIDLINQVSKLIQLEVEILDELIEEIDDCDDIEMDNEEEDR
jgi:hypothetical protein